MTNKFFLKNFGIALTSLIILASCDKDFNEIGAGIIDDGHFGFEKYTNASVTAFSQGYGIIQANSLNINTIGLYDNAVFGKTKSNFVTQLELSAVNPTFDTKLFVSMDSVVMTIPYFSKSLSVLDGRTTYQLDSINGSAPINLKVFESGFFMTDLDPNTNFQQAQKYYANQDAEIDGFKNPIVLNNYVSPVPGKEYLENEMFVPDPKEVVIFKRTNELKMTTDVETRLAPRMRLHLDKNYFKQKILSAPDGKLTTNTAFKNYFRGLYFQVADAAQGQLLKMDFSKGNITVYYTEYSGLDTAGLPIKYTDTDGVSKDKKIIKTVVMNMSGNKINLIQQTNAAAYTAGLATANPALGDQKLYLKGGNEGSIAIIDLFGSADTDNNKVPDELDQIRAKGWLINEASLSFYIDNTTMGTAPEPNRLYLYDLNNNRPIIDYATDISTNSNTKLNKSIHGGIIETDATSKRGTRYKFRITNHLRNLVKYKDSTNVRLALGITESIAIISNTYLKNALSIPFPIPKATDKAFDRLPTAAALSPLGTILYGSKQGADVPEEKRLKLEIYYTKPN